MSVETNTAKTPRGGHVGALLDQIEAEGPGRFAQEDQFLLRRAERLYAEEGGISDRQLLHQLRKIREKYFPGGQPPPVNPKIAELSEANAELRAELAKRDGAHQALLARLEKLEAGAPAPAKPPAAG